VGRLSLLLLVALALMAGGCQSAVAPGVAPAVAAAPATAPSLEEQGVVERVAPLRTSINPRLLRRFRPVADTGRAAPHLTPALVDLGRLLWFEPLLSQSGTISCNSCHALRDYGVDHRPRSIGERHRMGRRNAPTVYNLASHVALFWDGRSPEVETQALVPIVGLAEMAASPAVVEATLRASDEYRRGFHAAFPDDAEPVSLANVGRAIGAFERGLVTRSRWDDYLEGHTQALDPAEVEGLRVFLDVGCMECHTGPQVGASMFQVAGFVEPWPDRSDLGRFEVTGKTADRMVFKVPTLKNVARTAPYFHDGSVADLGAAVRAMGRHQLGVELADAEVASIVTFLGALTGALPEDYIAAPPPPPQVQR